MVRDSKFTKNQYLTIFIVVFLFLIFLSYLFKKYAEEIKLLLVAIIVVVAILAMIGLDRPKIRTPEEQSAYNRRVAELEAERDFGGEAKQRPQYDFGMRGIQDDFRRLEPPKSRKRY